jgi:hypothetical protein
MAKAIKFNLIIDKQPIRDVEDLRVHFNVEDMLEVFNNGSLQRWLEVRGMAEELGKLQKVEGKATVVAAELCRIFFASCTKDDVANAAYIFELRQNEQKKLFQYKSLEKERDEIISMYHAKYENLLSEMKNKYTDYPYLKAAVQEIFKNYKGLFILNAADFYDRFVFDFPLAIFAILANSNMRSLLTGVVSENMIFEHLTEEKCVRESFEKRFKQKISIPFTKTCSSDDELVLLREKMDHVFVLSFSPDSQSYSSGRQSMNFYSTEKLKAPFQYIETNLWYPSHIKRFAGATDGHFTHLEPGGKKCMIIKMESGNIVTKHDGGKDDELKAEDVNGKFVILDGVDYSGKNDTDHLIYMEI